MMHRGKRNDPIVERKAGAATKSQEMELHDKDLIALQKAKKHERKMWRKCVTVKIGDTTITTTKDKMEKHLESLGYSEEESKRLASTARKSVKPID